MNRTREGALMKYRRSITHDSTQLILVKRLVVTIGILLFGVMLQPAYAAEKYSIKDIGAIGAGATVEGLNERGEIVGAVPSVRAPHDSTAGGTKMAR